MTFTINVERQTGRPCRSAVDRYDRDELERQHRYEEIPECLHDLDRHGQHRMQFVDLDSKPPARLGELRMRLEEDDRDLVEREP